MGRTEGKNGTFIATVYKDENPSKFFFFHDPLVDLKTEARGYAQISDCYVHIFATVTVLRGTRWVP